MKKSAQGYNGAELSCKDIYELKKKTESIIYGW